VKTVDDSTSHTTLVRTKGKLFIVHHIGLPLDARRESLSVLRGSLLDARRGSRGSLSVLRGLLNARWLLDAPHGSLSILRGLLDARLRRGLLLNARSGLLLVVRLGGVLAVGIVAALSVLPVASIASRRVASILTLDVIFSALFA